MSTEPADLLSAAFHEAGHAVVSAAIGCIVTHIEVHYSDERSRWEGSYRHLLAVSCSWLDELRLLQKAAKVAVAGVLAQARFIMEQRSGVALRFSNHNDMAAWFAFFRDKSRTETTPGQLRVSMSAEGGAGSIVSHVIDGSLFSGQDSKLFNSCFDQVEGVSHEALLAEVVGLLDDSSRWAAVSRLAKKLCATTPTGSMQLRQLTQSDITHELAGDV